MKNIILVMCILIFGLFARAQEQTFVGDWHITDFSITMSTLSDDGEIDSSWVRTHSGMDKLKEDGSVWELDFKKNGEVIQVSNMRTGEIESHGGTFESDENSLRLNLEVDGRVVTLAYSYELNDDSLVLNRSNPKRTMLIRTEFSRK